MHANWEFRESLHTGLSKPANLDIAIRTQFAIQCNVLLVRGRIRLYEIPHIDTKQGNFASVQTATA